MSAFSNVLTIIAISLGIAILLFMTYMFIKKKSDRNTLFDDMGGEEFERFCVELLRKKGFDNLEMTNASHDYGIDIFGRYQGITYAIQCKCYSTPVGIRAIQEAYSGKDYYDCMVGAVMTNQKFTKSAAQFADKLNVLMWDGNYLATLMREQGVRGYTSYILNHTEDEYSSENNITY